MSDALEPHQEIDALEAQLASDPESRNLRERLLMAYCHPSKLHDPRRIDHILWYVRHFPREELARCPFVQVDQKVAPDAFAAVEREWRKLAGEFPRDPEILRGLAFFIVHRDQGQALRLLRDFVSAVADAAEVWTDLGRYESDPTERLRSFQEARLHGSKQPNLLAWTASSALACGDMAAAAGVAQDMLTAASALRAEYGEKVNCATPNTRWQRARELTSSHSEAHQLVKAISAYASHNHWAHTTLGVVALRANDVSAAIEHLRKSAAVSSEPRLSSYGPSFALARELCLAGAWDDVIEYLHSCERFWNTDALRLMLEDVKDHRLPDAWERGS